MRRPLSLWTVSLLSMFTEQSACSFKLHKSTLFLRQSFPSGTTFSDETTTFCIPDNINNRDNQHHNMKLLRFGLDNQLNTPV